MPYWLNSTPIDTGGISTDLACPPMALRAQVSVHRLTLKTILAWNGIQNMYVMPPEYNLTHLCWPSELACGSNVNLKTQTKQNGRCDKPIYCLAMVTILWALVHIILITSLTDYFICEYWIKKWSVTIVDSLDYDPEWSWLLNSLLLRFNAILRSWINIKISR